MNFKILSLFQVHIHYYAHLKIKRAFISSYSEFIYLLCKNAIHIQQTNQALINHLSHSKVNKNNQTCILFTECHFTRKPNMFRILTFKILSLFPGIQPKRHGADLASSPRTIKSKLPKAARITRNEIIKPFVFILCDDIFVSRINKRIV